MKRFRKVYLEISNICNLSCRFCPGTRRKPKVMEEWEISVLLQKLRPYTDYLYFHLMGEPLCHPKLQRYLELAEQWGFRVILTTNGTLLPREQEMLLSAGALHKINISLHAFEANDLKIPFQRYLAGCFTFGKAAVGEKLVVFRLWNQGGLEEKNREILKTLEQYFPQPWAQERQGIRLADKTYLEFGAKFDWPDLSAPMGEENVFCYGLKDQIGILCDGTVVPCCLDHEGDIPLGNLLQQDMEEILATSRVKQMIEGFSRGVAKEELCRRCGYARRFKRGKGESV